ncbi:Mitochondrial import inner membrane translocase subunit Tim8 A [Araneus ventricosus]|uniref:Mitochondrial import inner membrane translocase subunit n=1 Tax=Araneus ventricosus TaxID=182803 RepID=A0A4Y2WP63_ARAVE|nr:Mitochondrial import inner membrane translocase subunit Tim8 A [Araneus ventricosus]GBO42159.1 Mitochondrial import inner membrane translocase subunit Tim8 A [Araneus ventricosus]
MSFGGDYGAGGSPVVDKDLERFIEEENQKQRFQQLVNELNEKCWDICLDKPTQRLDSKTETCLTNCVNRFIDASSFILKRLERVGSQHHEMEFN